MINRWKSKKNPIRIFSVPLQNQMGVSKIQVQKRHTLNQIAGLKNRQSLSQRRNSMMKTESSFLKRAVLHEIWQLFARIQDFHTMICS